MLNRIIKIELCLFIFVFNLFLFLKRLTELTNFDS